jgi:hypothetical protein
MQTNQFGGQSSTAQFRPGTERKNREVFVRLDADIVQSLSKSLWQGTNVDTLSAQTREYRVRAAADRTVLAL